MCCLLEHVRTYSNVLFLFFVEFGLGDFELMPRKVIVKVVELCVASLLCKNVY